MLEVPGYTERCLQIAQNDAYFRRFKQDPIFNILHENLSYAQGSKYLKHIVNYFPELIPYFHRFRENDLFGNPALFEYKKYGYFSPSTLFHIKTVGNLLYEFGSLSDKHIIEIGSGDGSLAKIISVVCSFASYTIIDLPEHNALTKKYLDALGVENVFYMDVRDLSYVPDADIVISNNGFSSFDRTDQTKIFRSLLENTPCGYLICHQLAEKYDTSSLSYPELAKMFYMSGLRGKISRDYLNINPKKGDALIVWKPKSMNFVRKREVKRDHTSLVTCLRTGGRLGDHLVTYFHARWISYKYNIPLSLEKSRYFEKFNLSDPNFQYNINKKNLRGIAVKNERCLKKRDKNINYRVRYFPEVTYFSQSAIWNRYFHHIPFKVDWEDPEFKEIVRNCLSPKKACKLIPLPQDCITVALHVRRGGYHDHTESARKNYPLKFPRDEWYLEQVQNLIAFFEGEKLWFYIFTDSLDPVSIANKYTALIDNPNVTFSCRLEENSDRTNVLDDFFSMGKFDCLIRAGSNLSIIAEKLGDYHYILSPTDIVKGTTTIDFTEISFDGEKTIQKR